MKRFYLFAAGGIALTLAGLALQPAQPIERLGNEHFIETADRLWLDGKLFSGTAIERFPSGLIYREVRYQDGLEDGTTREFANNGKLRMLWNYRAGKKHGLQEGWFIEGPKRFEQHYQDGILEGMQTEWHLNGVISNQQTFADGVETQRKVLYPSAEVFSNYIKKNARTYGIDGGALCFEVKREGER